MSLHKHFPHQTIQARQSKCHRSQQIDDKNSETCYLSSYWVCSSDKLANYAANFHCVMFALKYLDFIRVVINISWQAKQLKKVRWKLALCFKDLDK